MESFAEKFDDRWVWPDITNGRIPNVFKNPHTLKYPFMPKSNVSIVPGHFWGMELPDGRWTCGQVSGFIYKNRTGFVAGIRDWVGDSPPTADDLPGTGFLPEFMGGHIKNFALFDTPILGWANITYGEAPLCTPFGQQYHNVIGHPGLPLRPRTPEELTQPIPNSIGSCSIGGFYTLALDHFTALDPKASYEYLDNRYTGHRA